VKSFFQCGEASICYEVAGEGSAVVLVHEGIADRRMWEPQVEPFVAAGYRVVRYDLRGYGDSTLPPGPFSHTGDLRALLEHLELDRARIVGVSVGGRVALELALAHPELVESLVLVGAGLREWEWSDEIRRFGEEEDELLDNGKIDEAVELNLRTWVDGPSRGPDEVDPGMRERVAEMQRRAVEIYFAALASGPPPGPEDPFDPPVSERLGEIRCPTLVLAGALDQPDILEIADRLAAGIPEARQEIVPGTAHVPPMEKPAEFNELVLGFYEQAG